MNLIFSETVKAGGNNLVKIKNLEKHNQKSKKIFSGGKLKKTTVAVKMSRLMIFPFLRHHLREHLVEVSSSSLISPYYIGLMIWAI